MGSRVIKNVAVRYDPAGHPTPAVFDSPHSGACYPDDFDFSCPLPSLRQAEDAHVDALFDQAPLMGASYICALFPRSYIDANRAPDDIDPSTLADTWPYEANPSEKSLAGMGLVRHLCRPGMAMYDAPLTAAHVLHRLRFYWQPYHDLLAETLDWHYRTFGCVYHVNCHSMPHFSVGPDRQAPDFVLGDRNGSACEPGFTRFVADYLRQWGYQVRINDPYKGMELVRRYAQPSRGRHSLQVEINRRLYMDETTLERHEGFAPLKERLSLLTQAVCAYASRRSQSLAAE
jgi:N-formylglutamate deformylase